MCKIAILENYHLFCSGIKPVLENSGKFSVVAEAKSLYTLIPKLKEHCPDIIIIDTLHSENHGIPAIKRIRKRYKTSILLIVSSEFSRYFQEYISLGANGLICNSAGESVLLEALNSLKAGEDYFPAKIWVLLKEYLRTAQPEIQAELDHKFSLTDRELSILRLFCKGLTYKEIGVNLKISPRTVETHKKNIASKINVRSTAEMVEFAINNNLT